MFDHLPLDPVESQTCPARDGVASFFHSHGDALINAVELLGGPASARRCLRLLDRLHQAARVDQAILRELTALHRLLSLDAVDDLDSEAAGYFFMIDPADPIVPDICALADALGSLIDETGLTDNRPASRSAA